MPPKKNAAPKNQLAGKTIVFTGTLTMSRSEATSQAEACGAKVGSAVSGNTDFLVAGAGAGQKIAAAAAKGVTVWTEDDFKAALPQEGKKIKSAAAEPETVEEAPAKRARKKNSKFDDEEPVVAPPAKKSAKGAAKVEPMEIDEPSAPKKGGKKASGVMKAAAAPEVVAVKKGGKKKAEIKEEEDDVKVSSEDVESTAVVAKKAATKGKKRKKGEGEETEVEVAESKVEIKKEAKITPTPASSSAPRPPGTRRPDNNIPGASAYNVIDDYDTKLNQTNIVGPIGNNKFYIIQVVEKNGVYSTYNRWGRVGEIGQSSFTPCSSLAAAVASFESKFKDKTKNRWSDRNNFVKHDNKYQLVETEVESGDGSAGADGAALGKLTESQIHKGQEVLKQVEEFLKNGVNKSDRRIVDLSSKFYSLIPTNSGRKAPEIINNHEILNSKISLLEFWLRMGFEDMKEEVGLSAIDGVMTRPLPPNLVAAASRISDPHSIQSSRDRGKTLSEARAGNPIRPMDAELYAAILLYTGNSIYAELNRVLRNEDRKSAQKYFDYLRLFMEAMGCMPPQNRSLWRGISVDLYDQYEVGKTITWWSVSSCTADETVARNFMRGCGGACTLLTLDCKTAMDISALSFYSNEKESLLAPGTQLKVIKRVRNGLISEIHVEEVGRLLT